MYRFILTYTHLYTCYQILFVWCSRTYVQCWEFSFFVIYIVRDCETIVDTIAIVPLLLFLFIPFCFSYLRNNKKKIILKNETVIFYGRCSIETLNDPYVFCVFYKTAPSIVHWYYHLGWNTENNHNGNVLKWFYSALKWNSFRLIQIYALIEHLWMYLHKRNILGNHLSSICNHNSNNTWRQWMQMHRLS